jgi:hypothetical protein
VIVLIVVTKMHHNLQNEIKAMIMIIEGKEEEEEEEEEERDQRREIVNCSFVQRFVSFATELMRANYLPSTLLHIGQSSEI